jgi:integrase/recombinase XerC
MIDRNYRRWSEFERSRAAALIGILLYAGLRKNGALSLVVSDVNFASKEIRVQHGKGSWDGKKRYVPIHPELERLLQEYLRERGKRLITDAAPEFFTSTRGSGDISASTLAAIVWALVLASGVHFTPHMLRHLFVTHLRRGGAKLHEARELVGHSHIETTLLYTKVFAKDKQDAIQKLSFGA